MVTALLKVYIGCITWFLIKTFSEPTCPVDGGGVTLKRPHPMNQSNDMAAKCNKLPDVYVLRYNILYVRSISKSNLIVDKCHVLFEQKYVHVQHIPSSSYRKVLPEKPEKIARSVLPKTHSSPLFCSLSEGFIPHLKTQQNINYSRHHWLLIMFPVNTLPKSLQRLRNTIKWMKYKTTMVFRKNWKTGFK